MHQLISNFSFPWYIWAGFGVFISLLLSSTKFRSESDAFLAHMLGMKTKARKKHD